MGFSLSHAPSRRTSWKPNWAATCAGGDSAELLLAKKNPNWKRCDSKDWQVIADNTSIEFVRRVRGEAISPARRGSCSACNRVWIYHWRYRRHTKVVLSEVWPCRLSN